MKKTYIFSIVLILALTTVVSAQTTPPVAAPPTTPVAAAATTPAAPSPEALAVARNIYLLHYGTKPFIQIPKTNPNPNTASKYLGRLPRELQDFDAFKPKKEKAPIEPPPEAGGPDDNTYEYKDSYSNSEDKKAKQAAINASWKKMGQSSMKAINSQYQKFQVKPNQIISGSYIYIDNPYGGYSRYYGNYPWGRHGYRYRYPY